MSDKKPDQEAMVLRACKSLRRVVVLGAAASLLLLFFVPFPGSMYWRTVGRAHHETTDCLTNMHDYSSIDKMFDEIILEPRVILFWTPFYGGHDYGFGLGYNPFYDHKCKVSNCLTTSNQSAIDEADAVVFHLIDFLNDKNQKLPKSRKPNQKYIFFHMEPPQRLSPQLAGAFPKFKDFFNQTMTYMTTSSIYNPFNRYVKKPTASPRIIPIIQKAISDKTKLVAWYAHCDEDPLGRAYVDELKKYIRVTTYGPCGEIKCGDISSATCWDIFEKDYHFFISIESAMCMDYVTERTYRPLQFNVIPLVYAFGNFSISMPPNSFINMQGFQNPKNLADFLLDLSKKPGALLWYMEWKQYYRSTGWGQGFCDLCADLNSNTKKVSQISDLSKAVSKDKCGKDFMDQFQKEWSGH